jgi:Restriction endonuclease BamHI
MKWLRTMILSDKGNVVSSATWHDLHDAYVGSIRKMVNPAGSSVFKIRRPYRNNHGDRKRNGVGPIRDQFVNLMEDVGWLSEEDVKLDDGTKGTLVKLYPSLMDHEEPRVSNFGEFDIYIKRGEFRCVIEWETGNISSSHRSMNKLCVCLNAGIIDAAVLILPSRKLYNFLTDRIGNVEELSGYIGYWQNVARQCNRGLLSISVVEHDEEVNDDSVALIKSGTDGNSKERKARKKIRVKAKRRSGRTGPALPEL